MIEPSLDELARIRGIGDAYHDYRGQLRYFSAETKAGILSAMGAKGAAGVPERRIVPLVAASTSRRIGVDLLLSRADLGGTLRWIIHREDGVRHEGSMA